MDWPASIAPYIRVAKLTIPQQDASSGEGKRVDSQILNPAGQLSNRVQLDDHTKLVVISKIGDRKDVYR